MPKIRVLVVRTAGINCDEETIHCWRVAGADPELRHIDELAAKPSILDEFTLLTIPGGFAYGDDIAAGTILAQRLRLDLGESVRRLIDRGGGILGICNGFQVLVKAGLLPGPGVDRGQVTLAFNDSAHFEARWVRLEVTTDRCPFLETGTRMELPVEHAEGRVVTVSTDVAESLLRGGYVALRYSDMKGPTDRYPENPNGSTLGIAGLCDITGRVFGLMPHPDRYFDRCHHPLWTRRSGSGVPDGLALFQRAVHHWGRA